MALDPRPEGVYCRWESWPPPITFCDCYESQQPDNVVHVPGGHREELSDNILHIERVNGDGSVSTFECGSSESDTILRFLNQAKVYGNT
jgi:hypothetical protein